MISPSSTPNGWFATIDQRASLRQTRQRLLVVDELQLEVPDRRRPEAFAGDRVFAVLVVEALEIGLPGHALDRADEQPLQPRIVRRRIGEVLDLVAAGHELRIADLAGFLKPLLHSLPLPLQNRNERRP